MEDIISASQALNPKNSYFDALREAQEYEDNPDSTTDFRRINNMERPPNVLTVKRARQIPRSRFL